ncbi:restriction endonuclease, partial [Proteus mirabilis]|nr:restriction endonuclease [Proteus mirabilis]
TYHFTNPFYNYYNVLIDLSNQVIDLNGSDFDSQQDSSAFFLDISMLFEYINRNIIKREVLRQIGKFEQRQQIASGAL